jgi:hypothetical protein
VNGFWKISPKEVPFSMLARTTAGCHEKQPVTLGEADVSSPSNLPRLSFDSPSGTYCPLS